MCAQALVLLREANILGQPSFIHTLGTIVRQSTEPAAPRRNHTSAHYRSNMVAEAIAVAPIHTVAQYEAWCGAGGNQIRHEHMVPTRVRIQLLQNGPWTETNVAHSLATYGIRASIHYEEDAILTAMGLRAAMPAEFYREGDPLYMDPMARYIVAGLYPNLVKRLAENWFVQDHGRPDPRAC
jgi:hypothetical protein